MAKGPHKGKAPIASLHDAAARRRLKGAIAVLPVGSIEQHGSHLPVSADTDIANAVCERICNITGFALLPAISFGVSFEHAPRLNLSVRPSTLRALVTDVASTLADSSVHTLLVVNGHYGNKKALARLSKKIRGHTTSNTVRCVTINYWEHMSERFDHAGHVETSLMLACSKADMSQARRGFVEPPSVTDSEHKKLSRRASVSFTSVAKNGVWGDPRSATRAHGLSLLDEISKNITKVYTRQALRTKK